MSWFDGLDHVVREQVPLAPWTWLRLGGAAEFFAEPSSIDELASLLRAAKTANLPVRLLGGGSNLLVQDSGVNGLVLHLSSSAFGDVRVDDSQLLAGGGAKLSQVVSVAAREGLAGVESLVGIPGTVGGATRKNAIGHGAAIGQWTTGVNVMDMHGETNQLAKDDLRFSYRDSNLDDLIILDVTLSLERGDPLTVTRQMQKIWIMKRASQTDRRAWALPSLRRSTWHVGSGHHRPGWSKGHYGGRSISPRKKTRTSSKSAPARRAMMCCN